MNDLQKTHDTQAASGVVNQSALFSEALSRDETMNAAYMTAKILAGGTMIPREYQGNPGNCYIASDMAIRTGFPPLMVMQQLAIVNGRPTWSGQACTALINQSRRYDKPLKICFIDRDGNSMPRYIPNKTYGAYAYATRDGEEFFGSTVTWDLVRGEGWDKPKRDSPSKWATMPEQMFKYRAASFFAREHCPDILMGCQVEGEPEDIAAQQITPEVTSHDSVTARNILDGLEGIIDEGAGQIALDGR